MQIFINGASTSGRDMVVLRNKMSYN